MKLLVSAPILPSDRASLDGLHERFRQNGFDVAYEEVSPDDIHLETLPGLVSKHHPTPEDRVVVLTNAMTYAFSWFRVWNDLVDNFVLFVDPESPAMAAAATEDIVNAMARFAGTDHDPTRGRVHLTLSRNNAHLFFDLFFSARTFRHLSTLETLDLNGSPTRPAAANACAKRYRLGSDEVRVGPQGASMLHEIALDSLDERLTDIASLQVSAPELVPHVVTAVLRHPELDLNEKNNAVRTLLEPLLAVRPELIAVTVDALGPLIVDRRLSPQARGILAFHMGYLAPDPRILEVAGRLSREQLAGTSFDYQGLLLAYVLEQWFQIEAYPEFMNDQTAVLKRCLDVHRALVTPLLNQKPAHNERHIAFLVGESDGVNYGPVKASFSMAKMMKRDFPEWRVTIFFTDRHRLDQPELLFPADRPLSCQHREELEAELEGQDVTLWFPEGDPSRLQRLATTVDAVRAFGPQILCSVANDRDLARGLLFEDYPTIEVHIGGLILKPDEADLVVSVFDEELRKPLFAHFRTPEEIRKRFTYFMGTIELGKAVRRHTRAEHGLPEKAFVLAIVGYDLDVVLREEIVQLLLRILDDHPSMHLALVGREKLPKIRAALSPSQTERTHVLGKQSDLMGMLDTCDAIFCPKRRGGGFAHCTAMAQGIPTLVEYEATGDVTISAGREMTVEGLEAVGTALDRLVSDPEYRTDLRIRGQEAMKKRLAISDAAMQTLSEFFPVVEKRSRERRRNAGVSEPSQRPRRRPVSRSKKRKQSRSRRAK